MSTDTLEEFRGFYEARKILSFHEARARVHDRLAVTEFFADAAVVAVHVENTSKADRASLTAFDKDGHLIGGDTLYVDHPGERLDVMPEFDHDFTRMEVSAGSELEQAIAREDGWVINMAVLRTYSPLDDRRATQRAVFLAHLGDMMASGQARGLLRG